MILKFILNKIYSLSATLSLFFGFSFCSLFFPLLNFHHFCRKIFSRFPQFNRCKNIHILNLHGGAYIWTTGFWVAVVKQFLILLSSSFFEKKSCRPVSNPVFITRKCEKLAMFYFWNIGNRCYTKPGIRLAFPVSFNLKPAKKFSFPQKFTCRPVFFEKKIDVVQLGVVQFSCRPDIRPLYFVQNFDF